MLRLIARWLDFDGIPSSMLGKLAKKQEETTRSMEKIEKREYRLVRRQSQSLLTYVRFYAVVVCYALRLRLLEYADRPDVLRQMAKRGLGDARDQEGDPGRED